MKATSSMTEEELIQDMEFLQKEWLFSAEFVWKMKEKMQFAEKNKPLLLYLSDTEKEEILLGI